MASLALIAVFAASAVTAFQCYKCYPTDEKDCTEEAQFEVEICNATKPYCRKMIQNVEGKVSHVLQCGTTPKGFTPKGLVREKYNTANDYVKANVYHCTEEKCNSASDIGASKVAAVAVVALAWMLH